tara:strand:+ start:222 stop:764 length:543 start_codon:yes stop_codon:yes gene_type:complete
MLLSGCTHKVQFDNLNYGANAALIENTSITTVLSQKTVSETLSVKAIAAGLGNDWIIAQGEMLKQFTEEVMPQYVTKYSFADHFTLPPKAKHQYIVDISIVRFDFASARAYATLNFKVYNPKHDLLLNRTYGAQGNSRTIEMWAVGTFTMSSIIQASVSSAYGDIFHRFMGDLQKLQDNQ